MGSALFLGNGFARTVGARPKFVKNKIPLILFHSLPSRVMPRPAKPTRPATSTDLFSIVFTDEFPEFAIVRVESVDLHNRPHQNLLVSPL